MIVALDERVVPVEAVAAVWELRHPAGVLPANWSLEPAVRGEVGQIEAELRAAWPHLALRGEFSHLQPLTKRQREIYDYIAAGLHRHGYAPSFEEIAKQFGFRSLSTVHEHLTNLEMKGWISRSYNESRAIRLLGPAA